MSCIAGPNNSNSGLVFLYDMDNTKKSWIGKPTINKVPDMSLSATQGVTVTYIGLEDGWKKYGLGGAWTDGNTYPYSLVISSTSLTGGVDYSTGLYIKTNVIGKFDYFATGLNYVNAPQNSSGANFSIAQEDGSIFVGRAGFNYVDSTTQTGYLMSRGKSSGGAIYNSSTDFVWIKEGQIEEGSFCTPYVDGTRSTAGAILDLTNNEIITADSLTYASDGSFTFNGTSDKITFPMPNINITPNVFTISGWLNPSAGPTSNFLSPLSAGVDHFLRYDSINEKIGVQVTEAGDLNNRGRYSSTNSVPLNTWTHFSASINGLVVKLYINGIEEVNVTETIPIADWTGTWYLGARANNTLWYTGDIANLSVYNRELTADEVKENFEAFRGRFNI